jgi:hypothetical protein
MPRHQPQPKTVVDISQQMQLQDLHHEINVIKNNHLHHMQLSITNLETDVKETKAEIKERFDKLDERLWLVIGLVVTTLVGIVVSGIM